ncbi:MAG: hypothetical protein AAGM38_13550, partial [Pseudomonadota bacterium]
RPGKRRRPALKRASQPAQHFAEDDRIARRAPRFELLPPMTGGPEAAEEEEAEAVKRLPEPPAPQGPAQTSPQPVQQAAAASASALGPPPQAEWRETALGSCVAATPRPAPAPDCAAAPASEAQSCAAQAARAERLNQIVASLAPRRCASRTDLAAAQSALRWLGAPRLEITGALDEPTIAAMRAFGASDPSLTVAPTKDFIGAVLSAGAARKVAAQKSAAAEDGSDDPWRRFLDEPDPRVAFVTADQSAGLHVHCVRGADDRLRLFFFTKTPAPAAALLRLKDAGGGEATARLVDLGDQGAPDRPLFAMATALGDQAAAEAKRVADFMLDARGEVTFELGDPNAPASAFYRAGFDAERASGAAVRILRRVPRQRSLQPAEGGAAVLSVHIGRVHLGRGERVGHTIMIET